jgi:hypothetical protein
MKLRVASVVLAGAAWAVLMGPAAAAEPAADSEKAREAFVPERKYAPLPGKVVGVLAAGNPNLLANEGRKGPADALCFSTDGTSYRWVYVPVPKKPIIGGLLVPVGEKGDTKKRFDSLSLASPKTVGRWGVTEPYSLVEVEVNGGLGGPADESFVGTQMKVLDGTKEYPLKTAEVIAELGKRYQKYVQDQQKAIDKGLADARQALPKDREPAGKPEPAELLYATWLPQTQTLRVVFQTRVADRATPPAPKSAAPASAAKPAGEDAEGKKEAATVTLYGVRLGMVYEVTRTGLADQGLPLPLETFQKEVRIPKPATPPVKQKF